MEYMKQDVLKKIRFEFPGEVSGCKLSVFQMDKELLKQQLSNRMNVFSRLEKYEDAHELSQLLSKLILFKSPVFVVNANPDNWDLPGYVFYVSADLSNWAFEKWEFEQQMNDWLSQNNPGSNFTDI
jgi:hypothetical protein